jgi:hypothetical protein
MSEPDRSPRPLVVTPAALTVVSGFVDAVSFLGLGQVFTANTTGNVGLSGFAAADANGFSVGASLCALGAFLADAVADGRRDGRQHLEYLVRYESTKWRRVDHGCSCGVPGFDERTDVGPGGRAPSVGA